jgi:hypothetical protein
VLAQPPVDAVGCQVVRAAMTAEIGAVELGRLPVAADAQGLRAGCHRLA